MDDRARDDRARDDRARDDRARDDRARDDQAAADQSAHHTPGQPPHGGGAAVAGADTPDRAAPGSGGLTAAGSRVEPGPNPYRQVRPPGMHDVARMAGVSHQTVSRVLNEHRSVRPETRGRVLAAIDEIGYRRNSVARALVTRRSGAIGVVTSRSALYGPTSVLLGVEAAARDTGYFVSLVSLPDLNEQAMRAALDHFADQAVEGVMVIGASADFVAAALSAQPRFPMVTISAMTDRREGVHVATVDHYQGAAMLMRHLFDLGHRDIAHVRGPLDSLDGSARVRAWSDALQARGITVQPSRLLLGDWSAESGYAAGRSLLADPAGLPTAVFSGNDEMALGLLRALSEAGVEVPAQVSVVGFDDIPGAAYFAPPLTTIRQEFDVLGAEGIRLLAAAISGLATPEPILVPPTLLVRASTAPPR